ncbi:MAG: DUF983 domain-containing protein, partial [Hyphomicrobiaceae bacterium]
MTEPYQQPSVMAVSIKGCCPRCGKSPLFVNILNMRDKCTNCGLDYKFVDTGDGPQVFAIFIVGFIAMGIAMIAEFKFGVPWWVHVILL